MLHAVPASLALALFLGPACWTDPLQDPDDHEVREYRTGERSVRVKVRKDLVGMLLHEDLGPDVAAFSPLVPLDFAHSPPRAEATGLWRSLHLVDPEGEPDRDELADHAHDLLALNSGQVRHAGVLVHFEDAPNPVLMTHEIVVQFEETATDEEIDALLAAEGWTRGRSSELVPGLMIVETPRESDDDALEACNEMWDHPLVRWCEPNFVRDVEYCSTSTPNDPFFARQWHHENLGADGLVDENGKHGAFDADIDSTKAWAITKGSPDVVIAILEDGFDYEHPDLAPNLWKAPSDPDMHGWDFEDDDKDVFGNPLDHGGTAHGTAVAGCAAARGDNGIGVSGSAPNCSLMLLRRPLHNDDFTDAMAILWAALMGADVISNSWTYGQFEAIPTTLVKAVGLAREIGRDGKGSVVLFSTRNEDVDVDAMKDVCTIPGVLTVGAVADTDERTRSCGNGMSLDVLGPSRLSQTSNKTEGVFNIATTDWRSTTTGYNHDSTILPEMDAGWPACQEFESSGAYTACFGGTSAATPIVAGIAALVLSVAPDLTEHEVRRLLVDTTDRVHDTLANYDRATGRSQGGSHGFGRANSFEAVRVVAPVADGGLGGVDLFVRDHRLDWGNTEQESSFAFEPVRGLIGPWDSPDVFVDAAPFHDVDASGFDFDALVPEPVVPGGTHRLLVRVRNRGPKASGAAKVRVLWTESDLVLPPLPDDVFTGALPGDALPTSGPAGTWRKLSDGAAAAVPYASCAGLADGTAGDAPVVALDFDAPATEGAGHYAFLVVVDSPDDPFEPEATPVLDACRLAARHNNVALLNRLVVEEGAATRLDLANPTDAGVAIDLQVAATDAVHLKFEEVTPGSGFHLLGPVDVEAHGRIELRAILADPPGSVELREVVDGVLLGGATLVFAP